MVRGEEVVGVGEGWKVREKAMSWASSFQLHSTCWCMAVMGTSCLNVDLALIDTDCCSAADEDEDDEDDMVRGVDSGDSGTTHSAATRQTRNKIQRRMVVDPSPQ